MHIHPRYRCFVLVLLLSVPLGWVRFASAQAISGDIVGRVADNSGAAVVGARLTAKAVDTGVLTTTTTNDRGEFHFVNLAIGKYNVTIEAQGFAAKQVNDLAVLLNQQVTLDVSLLPSTVKTVVEVSEAGVTIDTTTAQLESTFDNHEMATLPAASQGSGVLNLALLNAGVSSTGGLGSGSGGPSVSGQRAYNNNFTVEGVDNNNKNNPGPVATVPNDAVASLSVLQNQFSPEFGHSNGGQFNTVVISGTNSFHGRAYEYFQNRNLNGIDALCQCSKNPRYDNNRFGGQVGGPIIKDKLFFFQNLEYNPNGFEGSLGVVLSPTSAGYTTLNGLSGLSATNLGVLEKYLAPATQACGASGNSPCPSGGFITVEGTQIPVGTLSVAAPSYQNNLTSVTSVDYNISQKDSLRIRSIYAKITAPDTSPNLSVFYGTSPTRSHLVNISEYHTFSPSISNEARFGYSRLYNGTFAPSPSFPGLDTFPSFNFADLAGLQFGPNSSAPNYVIINTYQLIDNLAVRKGNHDLRFGGEIRKYISPQSFVQRLRGDYEYSTLGLFLQDISPDQVGERSVGVAVDDNNQFAFYTYANDNWRVRSNLSLNLGLRHEYTTPQAVLKLQALNEIASVPGLISFDAPRAPKKNFMPRLGFAWTPSWISNTSVRGGFGIGYDVLFDNIINNSLVPELNHSEDVDLNVPSPNFLANGGLPGGTGEVVTYPNAAAARAATSGRMPVNLKDPYAITWNFGIQHTFAKDFLAEVRYVGVHAVHQNVQLRPNKQALVTPTNFLPTYLSAPSQGTLDSLPLTLADLQGESNIVPAYAAAGFTSTIIGYSP
ncbi:MAG: TonB-dependent receptor, partial [Terriglobales bacterium]